MEIRLSPSANGTNLTLLASTISAPSWALQRDARSARPAKSGSKTKFTVTGSRIVRRDLEAASPIVTVDADAARELEHDQHRERAEPNAAVRARRHAVRFQGIQAGPTASLGIGSLNLRGIGPNRTLVLVDGRRAQPANAALVVDINTIPSAAIERVETITGGASAVYGADALAGVVNFILKNDFEGVDMDFQTGVDAGRRRRGDALHELARRELRRRRRQRHARRRVVRPRGGLASDRDFYMNGWFDPGSDAGGLPPDAPAYSPARPNQTVGQRAVRRRRRRSTRSSRPRRRLLSLRGCAGDFAAAAGCGCSPSGLRDLLQPDGSPFVLAGAHGYNGPRHGRPELDIGRRLRRHAPAAERQPRAGLRTRAQARSPLERRSVFGRATHELNDNLTRVRAGELQQRRGRDDAAATRPRSRSGRRRSRSTAAARFRRRCRRCSLRASRRIPTARTGTRCAGRPPAALVLFRVLDFLGPNKPRRRTDVYQIMAGVEGSSATATGRGRPTSPRARPTSTTLTSNTAVVAALPIAASRQPQVRPQRHLGIGSFTQAATTCRPARAACRSSRTARLGRVAELPREHRRRTPLADQPRRRTSPSSTCRARSPT